MIVSADNIETVQTLISAVAAGAIKSVKTLPRTEDEILLKAYHDDPDTVYLFTIKNTSLTALILISNFYGVGLCKN